MTLGNACERKGKSFQSQNQEDRKSWKENGDAS